MTETILMGRGNKIVQLPRQVLEKHLAGVPEHGQTRLSFMTADHHRVRYFVVRELPRIGAPLRPEFIAQQLQLPLAQVRSILDELERKLFFLARNDQGAVSWAFPVTVDPTPHRLAFSSGERLYGA
jgi:hypothetical protein